MTLPERLRQETGKQHEQTEELLYLADLRAGTLSPEAYRHLLRTHYLFHRPLERAVARHPAFFADYQPEQRQKTPWLTADLTHLHEPLPPAEPDPFTDWTPMELLGALYVGEGSMLGGAVVWKLLRQNPALQPLLTPAHFYQGYGPQTGPYWQAFRAFMTRVGEAQPDTVVTAAQRAFTLYQALFERTLSGPDQSSARAEII